MNMRHRKRALLARPAHAWTPPSEAELEALAALTQVRHARVALLRRPGALAELKGAIKLMNKGAAKVMRKMLAEDLKLMRLLDRNLSRAVTANP
jgi:hypothetical protein